ncbi:MAG: hypothetical protein RQ855_02955 [Desulfurococcales archaeon]|nr:hypothetical protein [Desulfurococcales archaeon]
MRVKTSIYIDRGLWERFREYALKRNVEISRMLKDIIREEIIEYFKRCIAGSSWL